MSRPHLGYSNYYWIRQDQKAAQKKYSELKPELNDELSHENTPVEYEGSLRSLNGDGSGDGRAVEAVEKHKDSCGKPHDSAANHDSSDGNHALADGKTQDYCNLRDGKRENSDGEGGISDSTVGELQESLSTVDATAESKDASKVSKDGTRDAKPGTLKESFAFEVPVRDGSGNSSDLPSAHRIDSWLPAPVPETDK